MTERVLETERLRLVPKTEEHAGAMWNAIERSLPQLKEFMSWAHSTTPVRVTEHLRDAERQWDEWSGWDWAILSADQMAGAIGINRFLPMWRRADLGYWVRSDLCGQGIATEATRAVVEFAFYIVDLNRLDLEAAVENAASQRVAEKVGFRFEGIKRQGVWVGERGLDVKAYGLLASDPRPGI